MRHTVLSLTILLVGALASSGCPPLDSTALLSLTPLEPDTTDDLVLEVFPVGETSDWTVRWLRDGEPIASLDDALLVPAASTSRGELWAAQVTLLDGSREGDTEGAQVLIGNAAPTLASAALDPGVATEETTLTCVVDGFEDPDGDEQQIRTSWFVDGAPVGAGPTLDGASFDEGQLVWCEARPYDGFDEGAAVASGSVRIANTGPFIAGASLTPQPASVVDTLSVVLDGWDDPDEGDEPAYEARWFVDGDEVLDAPTLPPGYTVRGAEVVAEVRPVDEEMVGPSVATEPITIGNAPPLLAAVTIDSDPWVSVYRAQPVGWLDLDGDPEGYQFSWSIDGSPVGSGQVLAPFPLAEGQEIQVTAYPDDGFDLGDPVSSEPLVIGSDIVVTPEAWGFGDLEVGCVAQQTVEIRNLGVAPGLIRSVGLDDVAQTGAITMTPIAGDQLLLPGELLSTTLTFAAADLAGGDALLVVETDSPSQPIHLVPVTGAAHYGPIQTTSFVATADQREFLLPNPAVEATLTVEHAGAPVALYTFDAPNNTVVLDASLTVAAGDPVEITYSLSANSCDSNTAPVAVLDLLAPGQECDQVTFSGLASTDPDGEPLTFVWALEEVPGDSALTTSDLLLTDPPDTMSFEADAPGDYGVSLTVIDAFGVSDTATTVHTVSAGLNSANTPPQVSLGAPAPAFEGTASCYLDAYGAVVCPPCEVAMSFDTTDVYDPDSVALLHAWTLLTSSGEVLTVAPDGESAVVTASVAGTGASGGTAVSGAFELSLVSEDCEGASDAATVMASWTCGWLQP